MFTFCPMCQLPLQAIKISPEIHVNKCLREWDGTNIKECPEGARCLSTDFYHYRDYSHKELAAYRSSAGFVEPKVEFTPEKRNSPTKRYKSPIVLHHQDEGNTNKNEDKSDDSDSDIFKPIKRVKRGLSFEDHSKSNSIKPSKNFKSAHKSRKYLKSSSSNSCCKSNTNQSQTSCKEKEQPVKEPQSPFSILSTSAGNSVMKTNSENLCSEIFSTFTLSTSMLSESVKLDMTTSVNDISSNKTMEVVNKIDEEKCEKYSADSNRTVGKLSLNSETVTENENSTKNAMKECENNHKKSMEKSSTTDLRNSKTNRFSCNSLVTLTECFSSTTVNSLVNSLTEEIVALYSTGSSNKQLFSVDVEQTNCKEYDKTISSPVVQQNVLNEISVNKINKDVSVRSSSLSNEKSATTSTNCSEGNSTVTTINSWFQKKSDNMKNNIKANSNVLHSAASTVTVHSRNSYETQLSSEKGAKKCPFYKRIPDTCFAVDAFQYGNIPGVRIYFLSHFHADHYGGLRKSFSNPIYCSQITANLVRMKFGVDEKWINIIDVGQTLVLYAVEVTALDANHCPGSVMLLFRLRNGLNYLHVGDFRADPKMHKYPELLNIRIEALFLDTTYCNPRYTFQSQEEVVSGCVGFAQKHINNHPKTLFACGTYTIGKEKVFLGIAEALDCKIWAKPEKRRIFACLNDVRINRRITANIAEAQVHVLSMGDIDFEALSQHLKSLNGTFTHIAAFRPSGWEATSRKKNFNISVQDNIIIYGVPYSEHSNFLELQSFVQFIQPSEVIQTVNVGNVKTRNQVKKYIDEWLHQSPDSDNKMVQSKMSAFFKKKS